MTNFLPYILMFSRSGSSLFDIILHPGSRFEGEADVWIANAATPVIHDYPLTESSKCLDLKNMKKTRVKIYNTSVVDWSFNTDRSLVGKVNLRDVDVSTGAPCALSQALDLCLKKIHKYETGN